MKRKAIATMYRVPASGETPFTDGESMPSEITLEGGSELCILVLAVVPQDTDNLRCSTVTYAEYRRLITERHPRLVGVVPKVDPGFSRQLVESPSWVVAFYLEHIYEDTRELVTRDDGKPIGFTFLHDQAICIIQTEVNEGGHIKNLLLEELEKNREELGCAPEEWCAVAKTALYLEPLSS